VVLDEQDRQVSTWAVKKNMLFLLQTVPVALSADSKLGRNSLLLLPEPLDIELVTRESESRESAQKMVSILS